MSQVALKINAKDGTPVLEESIIFGLADFD
jgi:hypothetical protein